MCCIYIMVVPRLAAILSLWKSSYAYSCKMSLVLELWDNRVIFARYADTRYVLEEMYIRVQYSLVLYVQALWANKRFLTPDFWYSSHNSDVIAGAMASQITSLTIVYSNVYSDVDERKHQSSASLAFVRGIHRWPVNSPYKVPVTRKMFPFDDVIMILAVPIK